MNTIKEIQQINERELELGIAGTSASWHDTYKASAWIYVGNLDKDLSEGDIICVLSQYGELEDMSLMRHDDTGASRGFGYAKYEDARSCVLAVDNLVGIKVRDFAVPSGHSTHVLLFLFYRFEQLCGRPLRVEHVETKRLPERLAEPKEDLANEYSIEHGQDLFAPPPQRKPEDRKQEERKHKRKLKSKKKDRKKHKKRKGEKKSRRSSSSDATTP